MRLRVPLGCGMTMTAEGAVQMSRMWIILVLTLSACAEFPEVEAALAQDSPDPEYSEFLPFEQLLTVDDPRLMDGDDAALRARAAELRARADRLRRPVIEPPILDRMEDGVTQP
jgi:hypothetical protein